jgi:hypothetical protein
VLHAEAEILLVHDGILALLQSFGPTAVIGSFALDLMTWRDLDVYVQLPHDHDTATFFALGATLTHTYTTLKASYSNHFLRTVPGFAYGLFWGIQIQHRNAILKLDIWGMGRTRITNTANNLRNSNTCSARLTEP